MSFWDRFGPAFAQFDNRSVTAEQLNAYDQRNQQLAQYYGYDQSQLQNALGQQQSMNQLNQMANQQLGMGYQPNLNDLLGVYPQTGWSRSQFDTIDTQRAAAPAEVRPRTTTPVPEIDLDPVRQINLEDE